MQIGNIWTLVRLFIPAKSAETQEKMRAAQRRFVALALLAAQRGYPLREYAVSGGYTPLIFHPWKKIFRQQIDKTRRGQLVEEVR